MSILASTAGFRNLTYTSRIDKIGATIDIDRVSMDAKSHIAISMMMNYHASIRAIIYF